MCTKRQPPWLATIFFFLSQPVERYKMPSWERNISKHDIIQHKQVTNEKYFFAYHKLGWGMVYKNIIKINRLTLLR